MKANFKVPHAASNKPKKPHQGSYLREISNYATRASSFPNKFAKLYCSARARTQTYHSRARGYKKSVWSSSLIIDGGIRERRSRTRLELAEDKRTQAEERRRRGRSGAG